MGPDRAIRYDGKYPFVDRGRRLDTSPVAEVKRLVSFARWGLLASALGIAATRYWFVTSAGYLIGCAVLGGLWACLMAIWLQPRVQTQQPLRHKHQKRGIGDQCHGPHFEHYRQIVVVNVHAADVGRLADA